MRTALAVMVVCILCSVPSWGQLLSDPLLPSSGEGPKPMPRLAIIRVEGPLLLLGSQKTDYASLVVDPKEITVLETYKDSTILATMGNEAKNGISVIELKNPKTLLNLEQVLDYFDVPPAQRQLRILLNKKPINESRFLADLKRIERIEVITLDKLSPYRISWDENEQFLNIVTVKSFPPKH